MRFGAVIAAAGMSTRMQDFKQLMSVGGMSFAERVVTNFKRAGVRDIVMVTGYHADELENRLKHLGIVFLRNENYAHTQMFDSVKIGLSYLKDRCDRFFFCPVDVPFFREDSLRLEMTRTENIVYPICHNRIGHPILIDGSLLDDILAYNGPRGLKGALDSLYSQNVCFLPVEDEGMVMDADTQQDLKYLMDMHNDNLMRAEAFVSLARAKSFFGIETVNLMKQIMVLGNVREACTKTGISYSKGRILLDEAQKELGFEIVASRAGGKNGGISVVTEKGKKLVELYEQLEKRVARAAETEFCNLFSASDLFPKSSRERSS